MPLIVYADDKGRGSFPQIMLIAGADYRRVLCDLFKTNSCDGMLSTGEAQMCLNEIIHNTKLILVLSSK